MTTARLIVLLFLGSFPVLFVEAAVAAACADPGSDRPIPPIALQELVDGLNEPVHLTHAGDATGRLFVAEQRGVIRVIDRGVLRTEPFLDIRERVNSGGEKGLLSVAFHPQYQNNRRFYVDYTTRENGLRTVVAQFKRAAPGRANSQSERVLLKIAQPFANHNGGQLVFGPDGYLYIGMGDGGGANDPHENGQNPNTLLGALLRIDVNRTGTTLPYGIPADNPFIGKPRHRAELWAYGLRNPWRFSFDASTGRLYLADVGQDRAEEIDVIERGRNYGWNIMEGNICTPAVNRQCDSSGLAPPIFTYLHPEGFSITGGFVYRGNAIPGLCGVYIYGDYVTQRIWGLRYDGHRVTRQRKLLDTSHAISSFGEDQQHELYVVDHGSGAILKIVAPGDS